MPRQDQPKMPAAVVAWFREKGAEGGRERARKYTKKQLSAMGKKGGRPRKSAK